MGPLRASIFTTSPDSTDANGVHIYTLYAQLSPVLAWALHSFQCPAQTEVSYPLSTTRFTITSCITVSFWTYYGCLLDHPVDEAHLLLELIRKIVQSVTDQDLEELRTADSERRDSVSDGLFDRFEEGRLRIVYRRMTRWPVLMDIR